ncbi:hypothetical protein LVO79_21045 (plasmid) [Roseivivax marinus]|uniref:hypothetical protein n=1 Tax=Roseivivax marinus TaxID=1379903 RepID=UPI001F040CAD|nr:hypothetical protein [Roseivivax marinus]UMA67288.1 hypothetical protein LVO79_21045 [Roseivivax marinus]
MARRTSLSSNVRKPDAQQAAKVARDLASGSKAQPSRDNEYLDAQGNPLHETVSYNLPVELIELVRDLAEARLQVERAEKRALRRQIQAARRRGETPPSEPPTQARRSASAIVREALDAHRDVIEAELQKLRDV